MTCPQCHKRVGALRCPHCHAIVYQPTPKQEARAARNQKIIAAFQGGSTYRAISEKFSVTRARARQICTAYVVEDKRERRPGLRIVISARVTRKQRDLLRKLGHGNISRGLDVVLSREAKEKVRPAEL